MPYVLVHGAGYGANCWDRLTPLLDGPALAVDLPGRGKRAATDLRSVTLDDCAQALLSDVVESGLDEIVLVAHSFAGVTVPRVMPQLTGRLKHVVFLSAVVPPDGTSVLDQIDPSVRASVEQSITGGIYHQSREGAEMMLCNDMDAATTEWTLDRLVDDSAALLTEPVDISGLSADVPRTYLRLTEDHCYPPELQEPSSKLVHGAEAFLPSGHMAMVSIPDRLASWLTALA